MKFHDFITVKNLKFAFIMLFVFFSNVYGTSKQAELKINDQGYFEMPGLNVLVYHNTFPEGHQGGVEIIQHEDRVATNGNLRLSPSPGQWQPTPKFGEGFEKVGCSPQTIGLASRTVDMENNEIVMPCSYPDETREKRGFNPLMYPDLQIKYQVRVKAEGSSFTITVDMEEPIPEDWVGRIGYNIELFPGNLYGKTYYMDNQSGLFPRQAEGPTYKNTEGEAEAQPLATGRKLVVAPECDLFRMTIESEVNEISLLDGSLKHNNGWFVVRSLVPAGATKNAIQWKVTPYVIPGWMYKPVVHISQVGYHPKQKKVAYIETDKRDKEILLTELIKVEPSGTKKVILSGKPEEWGQYLRYKYALFDFSEITEPGVYQVKYGDFITNPFQIKPDIYKHHVWQPTLEYFIPVQMCHMRVNQKYRVWHGCCHMDDALMAPLNIAHFDGYNNQTETSTLCRFQPLEHVPGLNVGGWHDAGDYDLRVESQSQTVVLLAQAYEEFNVRLDETMIDQEHHHVEIHQPDGKPDILQQVEHGVISILGGYRSMGRFYRGIICPFLRQYVMLGDGSTMTDNKVFDDHAQLAKAADMDVLWYKRVANRYSKVFDPEMNLDKIEVYIPELDDRLVWNSSDPRFQFSGITGLAAAARVLKGYNDDLAAECLLVAEEAWEKNHKLVNNENEWARGSKIQALCQLILTTNKKTYIDELITLQPEIIKSFRFSGATVAQVLPMIRNEKFNKNFINAAKEQKKQLDAELKKTPFGAPLHGSEFIAYSVYYLHKAMPEIFGTNYIYNMVHFVLGCRPGKTTNSLVSGVGTNSPVIAYGTNRADWSYIPGGTFWNAVNLVRPDFAEDKVWPFLWQEREYIIGGACVYMFTVLAVDHLLENSVGESVVE